jgi:hypothetical protein
LARLDANSLIVAEGKKVSLLYSDRDCETSHKIHRLDFTLSTSPPFSNLDRSRVHPPRNLYSMASSPNSSLLTLPPIRPSPTKAPSFSRTPSSSNANGGSSSQVSRSSASNATTKRARSSSIVSVTEVKETYDDQLDQAALHNVNAEWVNYKGKFRSYSLLTRNPRIDAPSLSRLTRIARRV